METRQRKEHPTQKQWALRLMTCSHKYQLPSSLLFRIVFRNIPMEKKYPRQTGIETLKRDSWRRGGRRRDRRRSEEQSTRSNSVSTGAAMAECPSQRRHAHPYFKHITHG